MKPIYEPRGKAKEYGDYAINIYTGCPHRCFYCYAPNVLRKDKDIFHTDIRPRHNIVEEVRKQLEREHITGETIHLCFTCDPYPTGYDATPTREIIKLLKDSGNHVQILTKGDGTGDFDLLDEKDWYGTTVTGGAGSWLRLDDIWLAHLKGIKTWISFEPILDADKALELMEEMSEATDKYKIGKLNYHPSDIDWKDFGHKAEELCQRLGVEYYIKDSLRSLM